MHEPDTSSVLSIEPVEQPRRTTEGDTLLLQPPGLRTIRGPTIVADASSDGRLSICSSHLLFLLATLVRPGRLPNELRLGFAPGGVASLVCEAAPKSFMKQSGVLLRRLFSGAGELSREPSPPERWLRMPLGPAVSVADSAEAHLGPLCLPPLDSASSAAASFAEFMASRNGAVAARWADVGEERKLPSTSPCSCGVPVGALGCAPGVLGDESLTCSQSWESATRRAHVRMHDSVHARPQSRAPTTAAVLRDLLNRECTLGDAAVGLVLPCGLGLRLWTRRPHIALRSVLATKPPALGCSCFITFTLGGFAP